MTLTGAQAAIRCLVRNAHANSNARGMLSKGETTELMAQLDLVASGNYTGPRSS